VSVVNGIFWTTGGGFSYYTSRAPYQEDVVAAYVKNTTGVLPPSEYFNITGRAYPDFAAVGHNLPVVIGGKIYPVDGTSAAAPIAAGIITLLNDLRLAANKPQLGFVNPLFYQIASQNSKAFFDVTVGDNRCGAYGFDPVCCPYGYQAAPGWDATSGLGTLQYEVLSSLVMSV